VAKALCVRGHKLSAYEVPTLDLQEGDDIRAASEDEMEESSEGADIERGGHLPPQVVQTLITTFATCYHLLMA
jgi:hypothetical protein